MHCVFVFGPVACGKLTVAKALHARTGWPLHHNHLAVDAALSLFAFGTEGFIALRAALWTAAFRSAATAAQSFIFTFAPERTVSRTMIDSLVEQVETRGGRVHFIELTCEEAEIERRVEAADRAQHQKLNALADYRSLRAAGAFLAEPMPAALLQVASDALTPAEAAAAIEAAVSHLEDALGAR